MMYPLVLDLTADKIPVAVTCRGGCASGVGWPGRRDKWRAKPVAARERGQEKTSMPTGCP